MSEYLYVWIILIIFERVSIMLHIFSSTVACLAYLKNYFDFENEDTVS